MIVHMSVLKVTDSPISGAAAGRAARAAARCAGARAWGAAGEWVRRERIVRWIRPLRIRLSSFTTPLILCAIASK